MANPEVDQYLVGNAETRSADHSLTVLFVTSMHPSPQFPQRGKIVIRLAAALQVLGVRVETVELGVGAPIRYLFARKRVAQAIQRVRPDVIHVHYGLSGVALPRTSIPVVTTFNGDDLNGSFGPSGRQTLKGRLAVIASQFTALRSSRCIAVSESLRQRLWTSGTRARTVVIRDAVDPRLFRPLPRDEARARLGLGSGDLLVMFPHDTSRAMKRVALAEAAVAVAANGFPATRLWIVNGKPPDDMPWYYAAADVMIVTSICEGGPSSTKEALACGIPVVTVPIGDTQLFEEAGDGIVVCEPEPDALGAGLIEILTRARPRRSLLPPQLTLGDAARQLMGLYREVVAERAANR